ncbi:MAG: hypothetical protein Kow0068_06760 [Marinilabiliales bacterium]
MHIPDNIQNQIDRYLSGEMTGNEALEFEELIKNNPDLQEEIEDQKHIIQLLKDYNDQQELKEKIKEAEIEYITESNKKQKRIKIINWTLVLSSAASVAIIATFLTLYYTGWFDYNKHVDAYKVMSNRIIELAANQQNLNKAIKSKNNNSNTIPIYTTGTCFLVSPNGLLATNYHVIKGMDSLVVVNYTDTINRYKAKVVYTDLKHDIALLYVIDSTFYRNHKLPYKIDKINAELGEYVYTLGYSKKDIVFGEGSISSLTGFHEDTTSYQISIPVNPGNSGGPLISESGNIIGIVSGKHVNIDGATYAVKSEYILNLIDSISSDSLLEKPVLPKQNTLYWKKRKDQIKSIKPYIYKVQVYMQSNEND